MSTQPRTSGVQLDLFAAPPAGPDLDFPVRPGMVVTTNYQAGPYLIEWVGGFDHLFCPLCGRDHPSDRPVYSLKGRLAADPSQTGYILNGYQATPDGRLLREQTRCVRDFNAGLAAAGRPVSPPDELTIVEAP